MIIPEAQKNLILHTLEEVRYAMGMNEHLSVESLSGYIKQCRLAFVESAYQRFLKSKKEVK
jgi:hypothetical protein